MVSAATVGPKRRRLAPRELWRPAPRWGGGGLSPFLSRDSNSQWKERELGR